MTQSKTCVPIAAALCLAAAPALLAQPGYMHQRIIGELQQEMFFDITPTPIDALTPDDFGSFAIGTVQAASTAPGDVLLVRQKPDGSIIWARRFDGLSNERGYKCDISLTGNYLGVFTLTTPANFQTGLIEVDPFGNLIGIPRVYRGTGMTELVQDRDVGVSLRVVDGNNRMITANFVTAAAATEQGVLTRTDPFNAPIWTRRYVFPAESQRNCFADIVMIPPSPPITFTTYLAVGTISDANNANHRILAVRVDAAGNILNAWAISFPVGVAGHLYGDGVEYIRGQSVVISGHWRPSLTNPASVVAVTLVFNPTTGVIAWNNFEQQLFPGRAAVDWRPEEGALVGGEWRQPIGAGFVTHPAVMLTDGAGAPVGTVWHTNSDDARHDAAVIFDGMFGKRVLAAGWGNFAPVGYFPIDALTVRANTYAATPGCPMNSVNAGAPQPLFVRPLVGDFIQDAGSTFLQGPYGPTPLRDDQWCRADPCDPIDFNNDGLFPDTADIDDFLSVFSGGPCSTGLCKDLDFNNDSLFPDTADIDSLLSVFSGGPCL